MSESGEDLLWLWDGEFHHPDGPHGPALLAWAEEEGLPVNQIAADGRIAVRHNGTGGYRVEFPLVLIEPDGSVHLCDHGGESHVVVNRTTQTLSSLPPVPSAPLPPGVHA